MPARLLLDTNVVSDFVRGNKNVQARLRGTRADDVAVSSVTVMEVEYGLALVSPRRRRELRVVIDALIGAVAVLPFAVEDARAAGAVRAALKKQGKPVGPYDVMLAGAALARGLTLITANEREFSHVSGLTVENWRA